jgi:hypothetical protein
MKHSIKGLFVILAIVMSFVLVQGVWAEPIEVEETIEVEGSIDAIERIGTGSIIVVINGTTYTFYHIPFDELEAQYNIFLEVGDSVTISAYVVNFPNGETKNIAYSIEEGEITYNWHPNAPKAGTTELDSARAVSEDCVCNGDCYCNCPKDCPDCPCDCLCECICAGDGPNGANGPNGAKN